MASRNILEITGLLGTFNNPPFSHPANNTWSGDLFNNQTFLKNDTPAWEWTPLLDQHDEFDTKMVGVSGTAVFSANGPFASADNPFLHPFGFDFEFVIAPDAQYASLLAPNNLAPDPNNPLVGKHQDSEYLAAINKANDPNGLNLATLGVLGLETDQNLVPAEYRAQDGDRVAVFGRWIVDTGHEDFHTEIHPPLLLACARAVSQDLTHSTVVGRPYLVSQEFGDDGLRQHLINEIKKVLPPVPPILTGGIPIPGSTRVEAHPQIKSTPFSGLQIMSYLVRPPSPRKNPDDTLQVRYHFTTRSGVVVQLINDATDDAVRVVIEMNDVAYQPALLPPKHDWDISLDDLDKLKPGLGTTVKDVLIVVALGFPLTGFPDPAVGAMVSGILAQGIRTDRYDAPQAVSVHDAEITTITVEKLGAGPHFSVDDGQPFPVYGFLDVQWAVAPKGKEGKEIKDKEKEKEASKDRKDNKENLKEKEQDSAGFIGGGSVSSSAGMLHALPGCNDSIEPPRATGQAFIRPEERPDVGRHILQQLTHE